MQLQLAAGNEHDHAIRHCRHAATRRDDGMIYTVASTLTKAAVGGLSHRPGKLVTPVKHPRLRHSSAGAAPASERAQLPAERSEERRLLLAGQRACAGPKACGGTIVTRPSFGALGAAPHVPTSGLTRNRQWRGMGSSCTKQRARVLCLACLEMVSAATRLTEFSFDMQQSGSKQDPHALAAAALVLAVALAPGRATTPGVDSHLDTAQWS